MESRFKEIELYEYKTDEKTSFYVTDTDENLYLSLESKEIIHLSINTKTGLIVLVGKILGAPKELKLSEWKKNQRDLIKRINICLVRAGRCRQYVLNAGIQSIKENYSSMSYCAIFQHDKVDFGRLLRHRVFMLEYNVIMDLKVDITKINCKNVSRSTLINLGLSGAAVTAGAVGVYTTGIITIPVIIALSVSGSSYISAVFDFTFELNGEFKKKGSMDLIQQLIGEFGNLVDKSIDTKEGTWEKRFEDAYYYIIFIYGAIIAGKSLKMLLNPKNYSKVSKLFENGSYINLKFVKIKNVNNAQKIESAAQKTFNKGLFTNDVLNAAGGGKLIYDKTASR